MIAEPDLAAAAAANDAARALDGNALGQKLIESLLHPKSLPHLELVAVTFEAARRLGAS